MFVQSGEYLVWFVPLTQSLLENKKYASPLTVFDDDILNQWNLTLEIIVKIRATVYIYFLYK